MARENTTPKKPKYQYTDKETFVREAGLSGESMVTHVGGQVMPGVKSSPISYENALAIAKKELRLLDQLDDVAVGPNFIPNSLACLNDGHLDRGEALMKAAEIELENAIKKRNASSFDNTCELVASLIERGKPLSGKLARWVASLLRNHVGWEHIAESEQIKRPRQHGPTPQKNYFRNEAIIGAINALCKKGLTPGRQLDDSRHSLKSLCVFDVVGDALREHGLKLGYKAIEAVWHNGRKTKKRNARLTK